MGINPTMQDEVAIRQIVRDLASAWNRHDGQAYGRAFVTDADYRVIWGFKVKGRDAIVEGHQQIFDNQYRNSQIEINIEQIRFLRSDVAHVETTNHLRNVELPFEKSITAITMTKENDEWRIATFNNAGILPQQGA